MHIVNGLFSQFSDCLLLMYKNETDHWVSVFVYCNVPEVKCYVIPLYQQENCSTENLSSLPKSLI